MPRGLKSCRPVPSRSFFLTPWHWESSIIGRKRLLALSEILPAGTYRPADTRPAWVSTRFSSRAPCTAWRQTCTRLSFRLRGRVRADRDSAVAEDSVEAAASPAAASAAAEAARFRTQPQL